MSSSIVSTKNPPPPIAEPMVGAYFQATRSPLYGLLAGLFLFALYELLSLTLGTGFRNGAEAFLIDTLPLLSVLDPWLIKAGALLGLGLLFLWRDPHIKLQGRYLGLMVLEAVVYALSLAPLMLFLLRKLFLLMFPEGISLAEKITLSLGAGLYEELLFRVLLFGLAFWGMKRLTKRPLLSLLTTALVSSLIFSAVHHIGTYGDPFTWQVFAYRTLSGVFFVGLYASRGFGIAALTHAFYDVWVALRVV